ncbi:MAG TPA: hypothetical protein VH951_05155, partial [Dehalococcoidia bacterium]
GASFVEAAITALGIGYLQKTFPEILFGGARIADETQRTSKSVNPWVPVGGFAIFAFAVVFGAGLIKGHGHLDNWAGLDWTTVNWNDAAETVLVSAIVTAIVLPLLYYALRGARGARAAVMIFVALLIWVPVGLIAPGGAFGEDTSATQEEVTAALQAKAAGDPSLYDALPDVNRECDCVPNKINKVTFSGNTILTGYQPPWVSADDPAWKQNVGYQIAGLAGFAMFALFGLAMYQFGRWLVPQAPPDWRTA